MTHRNIWSSLRPLNASKPGRRRGRAHGRVPAAAAGPAIVERMTIQRMDNVGIVVDDLKAAVAFFVELGLELEVEMPVKGPWVERVIGLDNVRVDIAMVRTPDGHSRLELMKFHSPPVVSAEPENAPANTLGIRRIMFAVEDIEEVLARLQAHGGELVGEVEQYEDLFRSATSAARRESSSRSRSSSAKGSRVAGREHHPIVSPRSITRRKPPA